MSGRDLISKRPLHRPIDFAASELELSKRVSETAGLEACKIKVFSPAFRSIRKESLSDGQAS
jgi:hypothetical protein